MPPIKAFVATFLAMNLVFGAAALAAEVTVYSTLTPSGEFDASAAYVLSGTDSSTRSSMALPFTPSESLFLHRLDLGLGVKNDNNDSVDVFLMADDDGLPGNTIEHVGTGSGFREFSGVEAGTLDDATYRMTSSTKSELIAGTRYWLAVIPADPDTRMYWHGNAYRTIGGFAIDTTTTSGWYNYTNVLPAARVIGVTEIPEPTTLGLVALGSVMLLRRRY